MIEVKLKSGESFTFKMKDGYSERQYCNKFSSMPDSTVANLGHKGKFKCGDILSMSYLLEGGTEINKEKEETAYEKFKRMSEKEKESKVNKFTAIIEKKLGYVPWNNPNFKQVLSQIDSTTQDFQLQMYANIVAKSEGR